MFTPIKVQIKKSHKYAKLWEKFFIGAAGNEAIRLFINN